MNGEEDLGRPVEFYRPIPLSVEEACRVETSTDITATCSVSIVPLKEGYVIREVAQNAISVSSSLEWPSHKLVAFRRSQLVKVNYSAPTETGSFPYCFH